MEIPLPAPNPMWSAAGPKEWHQLVSIPSPTPSFRTSLRELAGRGLVDRSLDHQALWIILHGLVSVSWTLLWRDLGDLAMTHESKIVQWKDSLRRAFVVWVEDVEKSWSASQSKEPALEQLYWFGVPFARLGKCICGPGLMAQA